jgi:hypothetical protein
MSYVPVIDDYVKWTDSLGRITEGWVYFVSDQYFTIEISVKDKPHCEYTKNQKHKKIHCLVLCFPQYWDEVEYIKSRANNQDDYKSQPYRDSDLY